MKKSLIWTAIGTATIGFGVPAFAAVQATKPQPAITTVRPATEDVRGNCDEAEHANDPRCATVVVAVTPANTAPANTGPSVPATQPVVSIDPAPSVSVDDSTSNSIDDSTSNSIDDSTSNSIDDSTSNSIDDISGPCDEAEHATDPRCTGTAVAESGNDNSANDDSPGHGGNDDGSNHDAGDDHGHGGSDD